MCFGMPSVLSVLNTHDSALGKVAWLPGGRVSSGLKSKIEMVVTTREAYLNHNMDDYH